MARGERTAVTSHGLPKWGALICAAVVFIATSGYAQTRNLTAAVLVSSQNSSGYNTNAATPGEFQRFAERYLEHLQVPYEIFDVATVSPPADLSSRQLILAGHSRLSLSASWKDAIATAVNAGTGFVNLDSDLAIGSESHILAIFGSSGSVSGTAASQISVPAAVAPGGATPHYIAAWQKKYDDATGSLVYPFHPDATGVVRTAKSTVLTNAQGTVIARLGNDPLILATTYGAGRAVHFGTLDYLRADRFGFLMGVDDLFWRSLVWAARKPFVLRAYPRLWSVQMDDTSLDWSTRVGDMYDSALTGPAGGDGTGGPWRVTGYLYTDNLPKGSTQRAAIIAAINAGKLEVSPHSFGDVSLGNMYWNGSTGALTDAQWQTNMSVIDAWKQGNGGADAIPSLSRSMVAHYWDLSNNTGFDLWNRYGFRYITSIQKPGFQANIDNRGAERLPARPFWPYEMPPKTSVNPSYTTENYPLFFADDYTVASRAGLPAQTFFLFTTQYEDFAKYPRVDFAWPQAWTTTQTVAGSVAQLQQYTWRQWSALGPVQIFTHDGLNYERPTDTERQAVIAQGSTWLNASGVRHIFMDDLGDYIYARTKSTLTRATFDGTQFSYTFTGRAANADGTAISTQLLVLQGDNDGTWQSVPGFLNGQVVSRNLPPSVQSITPTSGVATGGTLVTITGSGFTTDSAVYFGQGTATGVTLVDSSTLRAFTPAGPEGTTVDVKVVNPNGTAVLNTAFTYTPPPRRLVAAYSFDEGSGTTVADLSGNGNTGTVTGATWNNSGRFGKALSFNGSNNWVTVNDSATLDLTNKMTLEAWVNPAALGTTWRTVIMKEQPGELVYTLYANTSATRPSGFVYIGAEIEARGPAAVPLNSWSHLAVTYDGTTLRLYVNGSEVSNTAVSGSVPVSTGTLRIGGNGVWGEYFSGLIDEVRIFDRASTPAEIQSDMNTAVGVPDTTPPSVAITAPTGGNVSGTVTVSANASDNVGVAGVQFLLDGAPLGAEDTTSPYSISWSTGTVSNGTHTLTARARDAANNTATSAAVTVTVANTPDTTPPTVSMTAPADGATVSGTVTVSANASDNVGVAGVQFLLDGNALGAEDTSAPYSVSWNANTATSGPHTLSARARDGAGNTATSALVNVTNVPPDTTPPVVSMTAPASGPVTGTVTVSANASDNIGVVGVQFLLDGAPLGSEDTTSPYSISWNSSTATNGGHTLSARARDAAGNQTTSSTVSVTVSGGVASGLVAALGFSEGSGTTTADASGNSNNGTLTNGAAWTAGKYGNAVNFNGVNDNVTITNAPSLTLGITGTVEAWVRLTSVNRWNAVIAKGTANDDRTHNYGIEVTSSNRFTCVLGNGSAFLSLSSTTVVAAAQFYHVACVWNGTTLQMYVNGVLDASVAQTLTPAANTAPVTIGQYGGSADNFAGVVDEVRIYSRALSAAEVQADMNNPVGVADTTPPTVSITSPADGAIVSGSVTVSANASDNVSVAGVQFLLDGANLGSEDTTSPYSVTWNSATVANGAHTLAGRARDGSGNLTTSATVNVTTSNAAPDTTPPTVSMTAPANGATASGSVTLSATASDNVGVAGVQFLLDGSPLGSEDTLSPYSISWNSTTAGNGTHNLSARARDAAGNLTTSSSVAVTVSNAAPPQPAGLVASYGFNEGSGTTLTDLSGNGNNGTVTATTWSTAGKFGGALSFNGTSSWVTVPDAAILDLTTNLTVEAWVNPAALGTGWRTAIMKEATGGLAYGLYANSDSSRPSAHVFVNAEQDTRGTAALPLNTWTYLAMTYDGSTLRIFANGVEASNKAIPGSVRVSTGALRIGGNGLWGEYFSGMIDEVRIYNRALSATEIQADMNTAVPTPPPPDTTPPNVSVLSPASGTTIAGPTTLYAQASDNVGVAGVQFYIDGAPFGAEGANSPVVASWNTTTATNASHTITAVARDVAGNMTTSAPVTVTVSNTNDPAVVGSWTAPFAWPIVAVHLVLTRTGEVVSWDGPPSNGGTSATLWNPNTGVFTAIPNNRSDMFCNVAVALSDGRILAIGGHAGSGAGIPDANIYDPVTKQWTATVPMSHSRWYPTATVLPDGRVLVSSGSDTCFACYVSVPEIYDPVANTWTSLPAAATNPSFYYPLMFVLPDGRLLEVGATETPNPTVTRVLNLNTQTWTTVDPNTPEGHAAVMYEPWKIMKSGVTPDVGASTAPSISTTYILDMTQPSPKWQRTPNMAYPRAFHVQTLLPDGSVLAAGGGAARDGIDYASSVYAAELWSPQTKAWRTMASEQMGRLYHTTSVLLLDGRVLVAGSGRLGAPPQFNAEIFSPPYLFKGPRPSISSIPNSTTYGSTFFVGTPDAAAVTSVSLLKLSASTHGFDFEQRILWPTFSQAAGGLNVTAPANSNLAPPGYYALYLLNSAGVPSVGGVIRIQ